MKPRIVAFLVLFSSPGTHFGVAQTVEFTVPEVYHLVEGQLSITFEDGVTEQQARQLLDRLGYEPVEVNFEPVSLWVEASQALTEAQMEQLRAHPLVLEVRQLSGQSPGAEADELRIQLHSDPDEQQLQALLSQEPGLRLRRRKKLPSEIIIHVEAEGEEEAVAALEKQEAVKYVSYINKE